MLIWRSRAQLRHIVNYFFLNNTSSTYNSFPYVSKCQIFYVAKVPVRTRVDLAMSFSAWHVRASRTNAPSIGKYTSPPIWQTTFNWIGHLLGICQDKFPFACHSYCYYGCGEMRPTHLLVIVCCRYSNMPKILVSYGDEYTNVVSFV